MAPKVAFLLLGLLAGAVAGYVTRPAAAEIRLGGTSIEFDDNAITAGRSSQITSGQSRHMFVYAVAGGLAGLLVGFAADRRR